jgi:hypothetical protein
VDFLEALPFLSAATVVCCRARLPWGYPIIDSGSNAGVGRAATPSAMHKLTNGMGDIPMRGEFLSVVEGDGVHEVADRL